MTTPAASGPLYATVDDLRDSMSSTDSGIGTPAQLSDDQLTLALYSASSRVSVYAGEAFDPAGVQGSQPPAILHDLTIDLAVFFAWRNYLKGKVIPNDHPAFIAYQNATTMLNDVRDGKIQLGVGWAGGDPGPGQQAALVINRIPPIFTGKDSNTRVGIDGVLEDDVPIGQWTPRGGDWLGAGGPVYQG